jgi:hypothetical protein
MTGRSQDDQVSAAPNRPFRVSAELREVYDDNIFTTNSGQVASMKTVLEPSFLFNYPMENTAFSARYTMDGTAYSHRDSTWDLSHDFLARVTHSFNDRFSVDVRDRVLYAQQPEVDEGAVVARVTGDYFNNTYTAQGTMLWTPKLSTVTTFTNDYFDYRSVDQNGNDRVADIFSNDLHFQLLPTIALVFGGAYNNLQYFHDVPISTGATPSRDWQSFSPYVGVDYSLTPEWTVSPRLGVTYTTYNASALGDTLSPYFALTSDWKVGKRTSLTFNYAHSISQTDIVTYSSQESDSFSLTGRYQITPLISTHLTGYYNLGHDDASQSLDPTQGSTNENTLGLDLGAAYDFNKNLSFEVGYDLDNVSSDISTREYTRNQIYIGIRAAY